ncbi:MAG: HAD family hydrolase [Candidatus Aminicenantaceae bacterium]
MIKAIIFDLDGVLFDENEFVMSGFKVVSNYLASKYNLDSSKIFEVLKTDFQQGLRRKNFDILLKKINLENEKVVNLVNIYRKHQPQLSLHSDARKLLKKLKGRFKLGIVTDGYKETQEKKVSALNLKEYFDVITINDKKEEWKPSVKPLKVTLKKLGIKPNEAIYIGDNPLKDFIGCKKIGMYTVRIRRGDGEYNNLILNNEYEAEYTISNLLDLEKILSHKMKK